MRIFYEAENQEIVDALASAEVLALEKLMRVKRWMRLAAVMCIVVALLLVIDGFIYGDQETVNRFSFVIFLYLIVIWGSYWNR